MSLKLLGVEGAGRWDAVIREVCREHLDEPAGIWDALEQRGVEATPGMLCRAIAELRKSEGPGARRRRPRR